MCHFTPAVSPQPLAVCRAHYGLLQCCPGPASSPRPSWAKSGLFQWLVVVTLILLTLPFSVQMSVTLDLIVCNTKHFVLAKI